jgi:hypothetical protein
MSAYPPGSGGIADIPRPSHWAITVVPSSFDELVGPNENGLWYRKAERLCGLHIDDQFELRRPQDWKVVRLRAAQDLTGLHADLSIRIGEAGAIAH